MRTRHEYEPERDTYGVPMLAREFLEVDTYDYLRPALTYFGLLDRAFEQNFLIDTSTKGEVLLDVPLSRPPWSIAFVYDQPQAYDIRVNESDSVQRCYLGRLGEAVLGRDRQGEVYGFAWSAQGKFIIQETPLVGVLVWPHQALSRSELGEILASPGGFFRHLRLIRPKAKPRYGKVSNTLGSTLA